MPTHAERAQFLREFESLSRAQQRQFVKAIQKMVNDLRAGHDFRPSLRVKGVQGHPGIFEMIWPGDGRATFEYGAEKRSGDPHIIWRRIGGHDIFKNPKWSSLPICYRLPNPLRRRRLIRRSLWANVLVILGGLAINLLFVVIVAGQRRIHLRDANC